VTDPEPFFSIIIPTYNRAAFIGKTILSLLAQEFSEFEIIVIDDGSTDNTRQVVAAIEDPRIRYYTQTNAERAAARNQGVRYARGKYVNFFDSDDLAYAHHLTAARKKISESGDLEIFHFGYDIINENRAVIETRNKFSGTINQALITGNHLSCDCVFVRRDVALENPFNEDRLLSASEDYELWLRIAARFPFRSFDEVTSAIVNHPHRSVRTSSAKNLEGRINCLMESLSHDKPFNAFYAGKINLFKAYLCVYVALHMGMNGDGIMQGGRYLWKATLLQPRVVFTRRFLAAIRTNLF
jgi:glycosyltransferase involved in cell wall biosynthesis